MAYKHGAWLLSALTLTGCGVQSTPAPPIEARTITVDVPVATPCVTASDIPAAPAFVGDRLTGDARHDLNVVAAVDLRVRAALDRALALLGACVK